MNRKLISSGSTFEAQIGYSRAVVAGDWVFVSGTTGFDYSTMTIADGLVEQTEQCLQNIQAALRQAGAGIRDVVRVTYVLPNGAEFEQCWPVLQKYFGDVRPAAMMISAGLADPSAQYHTTCGCGTCGLGNCSKSRCCRCGWLCIDDNIC
jgi:enamine deaminase RidA (YjgF/YER057c/UK114 family)